METVDQTKAYLEEQKRLFYERKSMPFYRNDMLPGRNINQTLILYRIYETMPFELATKSIYPPHIVKQFCLDLLKKVYDLLGKSKIKGAVCFKRTYDELVKEWDSLIPKETTEEDRLDIAWFRSAWMLDYGFENKVKMVYFAFYEWLIDKNNHNINLTSMEAWLCTIYVLITKINEYDERVINEMHKYSKRIDKHEDDFPFYVKGNAVDLLYHISGDKYLYTSQEGKIPLATQAVEDALEKDPFHIIIIDVKAIRKSDCKEGESCAICYKCKRYPCATRKKYWKKYGF